MPLPNSIALSAKLVVPVPPLPTAKVEDNPAAVPVVFWFNVGILAAFIVAVLLMSVSHR